ncbi:MAG: NAD-dependent epimerase/dehydratase family protein [Candidatus Altiarchaeota archaeon]|nr:NAD-dependent epimerase/dehydratase family protein [Candidatus Altiarchaeota archaeon]
MEKGKALVIGGCGFIGSNIVGSLSSIEWDVVDDLSLGVLENLPKRDSVSFERMNFADRKKLFGFVKASHKKRPYDFFMMQNGPSSNPMYYPSPFEPYRELVLGSINVFDLARELDVKRVIYASTSSIYGGKGGAHVESEPIVPPNFYSVAKHSVEEMAGNYYDTYGVASVGFRYFSVYGPQERHKGKYANIISQFLWDMLDGKAPVIYGDGSQTRDFTYVTDVVQANRLAIDYGESGAHIFNVGTGMSFSFRDIVDLLNKALGTSIKARYVDNEISNYVAHTLADISKARDELGFEPTVALGEGIGKLVDYYKR